MLSNEHQLIVRAQLIASIENLIPLLLFRPLRLCLPSEQVRSARIVLLKITHIPYIASIWVYEELNAILNRWERPSQPRLKFRQSVPNGPRTPQGSHFTNKSGGSVLPFPKPDAVPDPDIAVALKLIEQRMATIERKIDRFSSPLTALGD